MADKQVNPRRKHHDNATEMKIEQRRLLVIANLLAGATYREIAQALNVDPATVMHDRRAVLLEWQKHYSESYERLVALQSRRYDILLNAVWERALKGDLKAMDCAIKILDRIDRIIGIPEHMDVTTNGQAIRPQVTIQAVDYRSAIGPLAPLN